MSKTLCLNMIVKNESHIIKKTLEMLCSKLNFDYWVICDTGSSDNTCEIITTFFEEKGIQGELYTDEWKNFAHNRTLALEYAYNKSDYLLIFDADDDIIGSINLDKNMLNADGYHMKFSFGSTDYSRIILINNRIKWHFKSVLHEYIECISKDPNCETIEGDYYIISGRTGSRNRDPNKYINDANLLEDAYNDALKNDDKLYLRYSFYCANSYKDANKLDQAIEWYKKVLKQQESWNQEKYMSCLQIYRCFEKMGLQENGIYYLIESAKYDNTRYECAYHLIQYYCAKGDFFVCYNLYNIWIKEHILLVNTSIERMYTNKLFLELDKGCLLLPFYVILVADKVKDISEKKTECHIIITQMFTIIFISKCKNIDEFFIGNTLYNLQFFIDICVTYNPNFIQLFQDYLNYLDIMYFNYLKYDFMEKYKNYGIQLTNKEFVNLDNDTILQKCRQTKNILFYTGYCDKPWNITYYLNNSLGGSETAVIELVKQFDEQYNIFIVGQVEEETVRNIHFVSLDNATNLINDTLWHTIIVSRYISFYDIYPNSKYYQSYIWAHDIKLLSWGSPNSNDYSILTKWENKINGCICQTEWHKDEFIKLYPILKDKIHVINNGINFKTIRDSQIGIKKITNRFVYTSCVERGLKRLLELWPQIKEYLYNASLIICTYNDFPRNIEEENMLKKILSDTSIQFLGSQNKVELYKLLGSAEYWLYPSYFPETSCITSMEMLASNVICLYYPVAGLSDTLGKHGLKVDQENDINTLLELTNRQKSNILTNGLEYALNVCDWSKRVLLWKDLLKLHNDTNINKYKYFLSVCVCIRNETNYLMEFIEHYIEQGVEHFYIVNNNSDDDFDKFIEINKAKLSNIITVINDYTEYDVYNNPHSQKAMIDKNFFDIIRKETKWATIVDIDEFMFGKNGYTLSSYLKDYIDDQQVSCIYVYWQLIKPKSIELEDYFENTSIFKNNKKRLNLDKYSNIPYELQFANHFGKSLFQTSKLSKTNKLWIHKVYTDGQMITNYGAKTVCEFDNADTFEISENAYNELKISLNHYAIRDYNDWTKKITCDIPSHRKTFIKGLKQLCELDDGYFVTL